MERAAIVIPVWKEKMTYFEKISFRQCCFILKNYRFCIVTYKGLCIKDYIFLMKKEGVFFKIYFFNKKIFLNLDTYNKLMRSLWFYLHFLKYQYILIYQLDCFVFRDELNAWIDMNYSYIGAPWLEGYDLAKEGSPVVGVGNGGFSLRKVKDHLKALLSFRYIKEQKKYTEDKILFIKNVTIQNNTFFLFNNYNKNEDVFWSNVASVKFPWFKIPDWKVAALFSVEVQPKYFFELNNSKLPFGCHAWWRYDLEFWKPHIEKFGYKL